MECSNRFFSAWFHQRAPWRHIAVTICPLATLTVKLRMRRLAGTLAATMLNVHGQERETISFSNTAVAAR